MKKVNLKIALITILAVGLSLTKSSYAQKSFNNLALATDSSYGYSAENPIKLKKGNQEKSIANSYNFLAGLKTSDGQSLTLLSRAATRDPKYKEPAIKINNRYTGMPLNGKLGLLDKYTFLTSTSKDTIKVYIDIYNKGTLLMPIGLKYEQPQK
jgi:hypothetical protein